MVFIKGYTQTKEAQSKAKQARFKKAGVGVCPICNKTFPKYSKKQITCGSKLCIKEYKNFKWEQLKKDNPIKAKAFTLFSGVSAGKNKSKIGYQILKDAIDEPCVYCGTIITIDNASLDHKIPRVWSKVYNRKTKKRTYTSKEMYRLDNFDNLHIVCRECNQYKSDMTDGEFIRLLKFLDSNLDIKIKLFHRLKLNRAFFARRN